MAKRNSFTKETASKAGKKSRRGVGLKTKVKEAIGSKGFEATKEQVIRNMQEALHSTDEDKRLKATKDFADYFVPKKREHTGDLLNDIVIEVKLAKD